MCAQCSPRPRFPDTKNWTRGENAIEDGEIVRERDFSKRILYDDRSAEHGFFLCVPPYHYFALGGCVVSAVIYYQTVVYTHAVFEAPSAVITGRLPECNHEINASIRTYPREYLVFKPLVVLGFRRRLASTIHSNYLFYRNWKLYLKSLTFTRLLNFAHKMYILFIV